MVKKRERDDSVTPAKLAVAITQATGEIVTEADISDDVIHGAPSREDGKIPLLPYIGWLYTQAVGNGC